MTMEEELRSTLFIKHLPSELSVEDQTELLKHFGATLVRCMNKSGKMKNCAFATFSDHNSAKEAIRRLHQLEVLGHTLSAEFSTQPKFHAKVSETFSEVQNEVDSKGSKGSEPQDDSYNKSNAQITAQKLNSVCANWGFDYPLNPSLTYQYPQPNPIILTNITNALVSVPKLYVQVLHLMNKMNLPAPFGVPTPIPPLVDFSYQSLKKASEIQPPLPDEPIEPRPPSEPYSTEESELDTDEDEPRRTENKPAVSVKRRKTLKAVGAKKMKVEHFIQPTVKLQHSKSVVSTEDVFESVKTAPAKKIEVKMPFPVEEHIGQDETSTVVEQDDIDLGERDEVKEAIGFGKIEPKKDQGLDKSGAEGDEMVWGKSKFISSEELKKGKLSKAEINEISVFRNYKPGDQTSRVYLKNLSKRVTEEDLHFVFGRYVDWDNDVEKLMFDIRLMKEGRMKGQAFVTLPSETAAAKALADTNGFILLDKPIVVQFARSAKPKEKTS